MNLEDYAYNQDDRWYVNPQVALDEQNAFINNLRNLQAQDNAQITRQTYGLGSQVPSNLGGLTGGGSYFRSRYQTPQTNQTIADLRSGMQAQALQTALQNELNKAKKMYKDAQNKAALASNDLNKWTTSDQGGDAPKKDTEYVRTEKDTIDDAGGNVFGGLWGAGVGLGASMIAPGLGALGLWNPLNWYLGAQGYRIGSNW